MLTETLEAETQKGLHFLEYFLRENVPQPVRTILKNLLSLLGSSSKFGKQINAIIRAADQAIITVTGNTPIN